MTKSAGNNLNKSVFAHLNINSIRNNFEFFVEEINVNIDVLMISETKLDDSFPTGKFPINESL